jgi:hypothetical protein
MRDIFLKIFDTFLIYDDFTHLIGVIYISTPPLMGGYRKMHGVMPQALTHTAVTSHLEQCLWRYPKAWSNAQGVASCLVGMDWRGMPTVATPPPDRYDNG